ncbi:MAG TPA: outer membrane beta-barrel protein [Kofleriaceae bacterium]|nr:outer membrane beta-barrel protein [Kofleriaceae bacterium]
MRFIGQIVIATLATAAFAATAHAQPVMEDHGIAVAVGGGAAGYTEKGMRDNTSVSGSWDVTAQFSTRSWLSLEGEYLGTASSIDSLIGGKNANLVGHAIGGDVRVNLLPEYFVQPYAFVGAAYRRYDVTGASFSTSDAGMNDSDNQLEIPMGLGVAYRDPSGLVADLRGTFRAATDAQLVLTGAGNTDYVPMHNWGAVARIGYEF